MKAHAPFASVDAMVARRNDLLGDAEQVRALTGAALEVLSSHHAVDASRLAAIGYCLGGALVLEHARTGADLKAVAGVHPSLHLLPLGAPREQFYRRRRHATAPAARTTAAPAMSRNASRF